MIAYLKLIYRFALGLAALSLAVIGEAAAQVQDGAFQFGLVGGTARPSVLAVLRLITSSNLVGCSPGGTGGETRGGRGVGQR
jgi:hypothetical protein